MRPNVRILSAVLTLTAGSYVAAGPAGVTLIGKGSVPGDALDKSGLTGKICKLGADPTVPANCVPQAIYGGFGSALAYTGHDGVFVAAPDRGPFDGLTDVPYLDRVNFIKVTVDPNAPFPNISTKLLETRLLKNYLGQSFVGAAGSFNLANDKATLRLDPEGIRVGILGTFFISDEYGPYIYEFTRQGYLLRRINVPQKFSIANPNSDPSLELLGNSSGRQANRGMEGLAITPNGLTLFGIMQNALLQDNGLNPGTTDRLGLNNRILKVDLLTGKTREYVYVLDAINRGQGASEILAINDHEFLVIERDNRSFLSATPQAPTRKTIYKIDITGATDVSQVATLPAGALPAGIVPVTKTLFLDLLDPTFGLSATIAEKLEGLAWGPDLPDGRHLLYLMSDNDLNPAQATQIYAFAIDESALGLDYQRQFLPFPFYPPWLAQSELREEQ